MSKYMLKTHNINYICMDCCTDISYQWTQFQVNEMLVVVDRLTRKIQIAVSKDFLNKEFPLLH